MKKLIALALVCVMLVGLLTGCMGVDTSKLKVALVVAGTFGDRSFYDSAKEGAERLAKDFDVELTTNECANENHSQKLKNAADEANIVVCVGWEFSDIETIAPTYPDVRFIWIDNATSQPVANVLNITYAQNEGSLLAGYIAAALSKSHVVGAVGGEDSDTINDFIVGYEQGAKLYDESTKVVKNYTNSYDEPALGKECALALHDEGADVIFQIASASGDGVFEAAKEKGFYAIGVDSDQKHINPDVIVCSMKKEVGNSIYDAIKGYIENGEKFDKWGTTWTTGLSDGFVGIGYGDEKSTQQVSDELKAEVEALAAKVASGEIQVATTR